MVGVCAWIPGLDYPYFLNTDLWLYLFFFLWVHEATRWQHEACIHLAHNSFKCSIMGMKKCPSHQTPWYLKIKALTCSNCLSVWSWRGGELSVSSLHKSKQGEKVRSKNLKTHGNIKLCVGGGGYTPVMWPVILDEGSWVLWKKWQKKAKSALNEHKQTRQEWVKTCTSRSMPTQNSQVMVSPFYCVPLKTKSSSWNLKATKSPFSITAWCHLHLCIGVSAGERRNKRGATGSKFNWASLPTNGGGVCLYSHP